jgi:hypothetical protein
MLAMCLTPACVRGLDHLWQLSCNEARQGVCKPPQHDKLHLVRRSRSNGGRVIWKVMLCNASVEAVSVAGEGGHTRW